jgi:hypothetical protein
VVFTVGARYTRFSSVSLINTHTHTRTTNESLRFIQLIETFLFRVCVWAVCFDDKWRYCCGRNETVREREREGEEKIIRLFVISTCLFNIAEHAAVSSLGDRGQKKNSAAYTHTHTLHRY